MMKLKEHLRVVFYDIYCDFKYIACPMEIFDQIHHVTYHDLLHLFLGKDIYSKDLFVDVVESDCHDNFYRVEQCTVIYPVNTKIKDVNEHMEILMESCERMSRTRRG